MSRKIKKQKRLKWSAPATCYFCDKSMDPDFKNLEELDQFLTSRRKIVPRRGTGLCSKHQKQLSRSVKIARELAML